jgi:multisubunit Na+/H+ antiporter MnhG subunit
VFLYLAFAIGSSIRLSPADIHGATSGFLTILGLLLLFNLATLWMADATATILGMMSTFYGFFYAITSIALVMNLVALLLLFLLAVVLPERR